MGNKNQALECDMEMGSGNKAYEDMEVRDVDGAIYYRNLVGILVR